MTSRSSIGWLKFLASHTVPLKSPSLGRLLRRWLHLRHAGRHALPYDLAKRHLLRASEESQRAALSRVASLSNEVLLEQTRARPDGLTQREAAARLRALGPNSLIREPLGAARWVRWRSIASPFNILLAILAGLAWSVDDLAAASVIAAMVVLASALRLIQEGRARHAVERLQSLVRSTATVLRRRRGNALRSSEGIENQAPWQEVPIDTLVTGDIVRIAAGDVVPADCRLLDSRGLFVTQASLTGESLPVEKISGVAASSGADVFSEPSLVFMGSTVISGSGTALVVATGSRTIFGHVASAVSQPDTDAGSLQSGMNQVGLLLMKFAAVLIPLVFIATGLSHQDWSAALLFALSVAVGLTPEMLPIVVTTALAKGAIDLSRSRVVVKSLDAIQALGAMTVLCIDKTGTLTEDRIVLDQHLDIDGRDSAQVFRLAWLNSYFQTGLTSALDRAVVNHPEAQALSARSNSWRVVDEIPFDFERRRVSVVIDELDSGKRLLVSKGAVEEILRCCVKVRSGERDQNLGTAEVERVRSLVERMGQQGLRAVAIACKAVDPTLVRYAKSEEAGLTLAGIVAFLDPPRQSAAPALAALAAHGVRTYVLTGDTAAISATVCERVGISSSRMLSGDEVDVLDDSALLQELKQTHVVVRLTPGQKERIVRILRASGAVVGFLGDGINDGPALRAADVGLSVDSAVDVAREAADIVLLEKSLLVVDAGVIKGRAAFCNMNRYLRMAAGSNFGNVLSVVVASAFLPFLPMLPIQLLVQNLLYDLAQVALPFDRVESQLVTHPLRWDPAEIGRFMLWFGPLSSIFDLSAFMVLTQLLGLDTADSQAQFQASWLLLGLATQVLAMQVLRAPGLPLIHQHAAWPVTLASICALSAGVWLTLGPLARVFGFEAPPAAWFAWMGALLLGYLLAASFFSRRVFRPALV